MDIYPAELTISSARALLRTGDITAASLTDACLRQIERLNPELNAFITLEKVERRELGNDTLLFGIPVAIKDLIETAGIRTTAGSLFFKDYVPEHDATVVQRLKTAGAIILGKTNTHEIALGVTGVNPHFGTVRNPYDPRRISGGSSSGSAVAVATGMCMAALGTDTGGSIRIPAALCGVVGLKPTYGRVSLSGVIPLSWNLDHVGPLTHSVMDTAFMLSVLACYDPDDPASADVAVDDYLADIDGGVKGWRAALADGEYFEDTDPEVAGAISNAAKVYQSLGMKVEKVEMSWLKEAALANAQMTQVDAAAYHRERFDAHPDWFGADVRQRLETGRALTSVEYSLARRTQAEMRHRFESFFATYDVLLLPTTPITAPLIESTEAVQAARQLTRFTAPFNLAGLPALSIPCGVTKTELPIGLQIVSRAWGEIKILRAGQVYESIVR